jgi:hypothetical protein
MSSFNGDFNNFVVGSGSGSNGLIVYSGTSNTGSIAFNDTANTSLSGMVRYDHSSDAMSFWTGGANERARIDGNGRLLVGLSTSRDGFYAQGNIQLEGTGYLDDAIALTHNSTTSYWSGRLNFCRSRGTAVGSNTLVASGDTLGEIYFTGNDGTNFIESAKIAVQVDGTPGSNDMPGRLVFSTTADGASSATEKMRITSDAYLRMASGSGGIQFNGDTAAANALDDYEEGNWTPNLGSWFTTSSAVGRYTKVGQHVTASAEIITEMTNYSSTNSQVSIGLPFVISANNAGGFPIMVSGGGSNFGPVADSFTGNRVFITGKATTTSTPYSNIRMGYVNTGYYPSSTTVYIRFSIAYTTT